MMRPKLRAIILAAAALPLLAAGCNGASAKATLPAAQGETKATLGVRVASPQTKLDSQLVRATGRLEARNEALVGPMVSGSISELLVEVGDRVKKGQPLARLDAGNVVIAVEQARAAQAVAKAGLDVSAQELERARKLRASGGVSEAGFDRAEAAHKQAVAGHKQASAAVRAAERALADHTLRAPFDGVVTAKVKNVGEYVSVMPATPVFSLVDVDSLEVVLPVPETVIAAVEPGAIVRGQISPSGQRFEAKVRTVGAVVEPQARTVEVRADLTGERSAQMRPHAIVEVDFAGDSLSGLFISRQALRQDGEARFVWLVEGSVVTRRDVRVEPLTPGVLRVVEGLKGDEQIVVDAGAALSAGTQVRVLQ